MERVKGLDDRVLDVVRRGLEARVDLDTDLIENGILDSLSFVELLVRIEEEFTIEIGMADLEVDDFRDARSITRFLGRSHGIT